MLKEFKEFVSKGSAIDLAVGVVIGAAFGKIVTSLVDDIIMPPIGLILGKVDFSNLYFMLQPGKVPGPYASLADAKKAGAVTINIGAFINVLISFLIISIAIFLLVKVLNKLRRKQEATTKDCPYCKSKIDLAATRCAFCTSEIKAA